MYPICIFQSKMQLEYITNNNQHTIDINENTFVMTNNNQIDTNQYYYNNKNISNTLISDTRIINKEESGYNSVIYILDDNTNSIYNVNVSTDIENVDINSIDYSLIIEYGERYTISSITGFGWTYRCDYNGDRYYIHCGEDDMMLEHDNDPSIKEILDFVVNEINDHYGFNASYIMDTDYRGHIINVPSNFNISIATREDYFHDYYITYMYYPIIFDGLTFKFNLDYYRDDSIIEYSRYHITSNNFNYTLNILNQLDNMGCMIAIDDVYNMKQNDNQPNYTITCNYKVEGSY